MSVRFSALRDTGRSVIGRRTVWPAMATDRVAHGQSLAALGPEHSGSGDVPNDGGDDDLAAGRYARDVDEEPLRHRPTYPDADPQRLIGGSSIVSCTSPLTIR